MGAAALIASVTLASPVWAGVGDGRLLEVDYTNDFVLLEGYPEVPLTVEVFRQGVAGPIGTFTGTPELAMSVAERCRIACVPQWGMPARSMIRRQPAE